MTRNPTLRQSATTTCGGDVIGSLQRIAGGVLVGFLAFAILVVAL